MWFRIWRPRNANIMDRVYNLQVDSETGTTSTGGPMLNCRDLPLNETGFFEVRENDILAVYIPPLVNSVQIIARDSAAGLYFDSRRGAFPVLATRLQTNDLTERSTLGLHLYADISKYTTFIVIQPPATGSKSFFADILAGISYVCN